MCYSVFMKQFRNNQLEEQKKKEEKIESILEDEDEKPQDPSINPLVARNQYRKDRLDRIAKLRSNDNELAINAPTREELLNKPSLREVRERPMKIKNDKLHLDKEDKDSYM